MNRGRTRTHRRDTRRSPHSAAGLLAGLLIPTLLAAARPAVGHAQNPPLSGPPAFSTFLGGRSWEVANGVAVDEQGAMYVVGRTASPDWPTTAGAFDTTASSTEGFVVKLASGGGRVEYATFLGGSGDDSAYAVAVEGGIAYVVGETSSTDFPATSGTRGESDAFVVALDATGKNALFATLLGGSDQDHGYGIAVEDGSVYVTGITYSDDFPAAGVPRQGDAFAAKLDGSGHIAYASLLGGSDVDAGFAVAASGGEAWIAGETSSRDFPAGGYQGNRDAFVVRLTAAGAISFATLLGGAGDDSAAGLAVDDGGVAYITGRTDSAQLSAAQGSYAGGGDAFVAAVAPMGSATWARYLGGSAQDEGRGIAVGEDGVLYLAGATGSTDLPVTPGAYQASLAGGRDAFLLRFDLAAGRAPDLVYATYVGGTGDDAALGLGMGRLGVLCVAGSTRSADFPVSPGAPATELDGIQDAFASAWEVAPVVMPSPTAPVPTEPPGATPAASALPPTQGPGPVETMPPQPGATETPSSEATEASPTLAVAQLSPTPTAPRSISTSAPSAPAGATPVPSLAATRPAPSPAATDWTRTPSSPGATTLAALSADASPSVPASTDVASGTEQEQGSRRAWAWVLGGAAAVAAGGVGGWLLLRRRHVADRPARDKEARAG